MGIENLKLGNMRKAKDWSIYPVRQGEPLVIIQCDNRIAQITIATGEGKLSDGKNGHQGFHKLQLAFGSTKIQMSPADLARLQEKINYSKDGTAILVGKES